MKNLQESLDFSQPVFFDSKQGGGAVLEEKSLKILVVDDEPLNLRVAVAMLEDLGYRVETASCGHDAILKYNPTFHLVLLDIGLPDMDGYAVAKMIRDCETPDERVPIIACTAYDLSEVTARCLSVGMDAVVNKPISFCELGKLIARHTSSSEKSVQ